MSFIGDSAGYNETRYTIESIDDPLSQTPVESPSLMRKSPFTFRYALSNSPKISGELVDEFEIYNLSDLVSLCPALSPINTLSLPETFINPEKEPRATLLLASSDLPNER